MALSNIHNIAKSIHKVKNRQTIINSLDLIIGNSLRSYIKSILEEKPLIPSKLKVYSPREMTITSSSTFCIKRNYLNVVFIGSKPPSNTPIKTTIKSYQINFK